MHLFVLLLLLPALVTALPRFEVHWESEKSYDDVDPLMSPWYIRLGNILAQLFKENLAPFIQGTSTWDPLASLEVRTW